MTHGGAPPLWANILDAAEAWGVPPWDLAGGSKLVWFLRWQYYAEQRMKARESRYGG